MDIETQLQFIDTEIAQCDTKKAALVAIRASIVDASSVHISSIAPLQARVEVLETTVVEKDTEIERLTVENQAFKDEPENLNGGII